MTVNPRERFRPVITRAQELTGWAIDSVPRRSVGPAPPWDYEELARRLLRTTGRLLDMGTGGGEVLARICTGFRGSAVATEEWDRNAPVARARLEPLGIAVVRCKSLHLPFRAGSFDLVLNRHEELDPSEIARVLAPGGRVLTQQVGGEDWQELRAYFPRMSDSGPLFDSYLAGFDRAGLRTVRATRHSTQVRYPGLEEVLFLLAVSPWTIPGFDPLGRDLPALLDLEKGLGTAHGIVLTESRFVIEARKPGRRPVRSIGSARAGTTRS